MGQNFNLDEAPARKAKNTKVLFRGVSKNPHKVIVGLQAEDRVIGKHIQEIFDNVIKKIAQISILLFQVLGLNKTIPTLIHLLLDV